MRIKENWIGFCTITKKEIQRFSRLWMQTIVPSAITMTLYFIIFGGLIGSQLENIHGVTYMQYIAPGLIMMSVITGSYTNVVFSFFMTRFNKSIEEVLVSPLPNILILAGYVTAGVLRGLMVGIVVTCIALFFTDLTLQHAWVTLITAISSALLFSLAGFTNGLYARNFDDTAIVPTFVLTPLTYLGGVFYSLQSLTGIWQTLSLANPILYIVNAFRYGILGISDVSIITALVMILGLSAILFMVNLRLLNKGVGIRT